ncbi:hypothetical protein NPIL_311791 [Nephila pilipes]|uniref:Uncharacterized protein n=1 Tax=Nephila pilipes TaxID=299642 RepID=A0A8X6NQZ7_NEPPI|nr:hypothetical protein NPIL_311791 [Nephila pilipes]
MTILKIPGFTGLHFRTQISHPAHEDIYRKCGRHQSNLSNVICKGPTSQKMELVEAQPFWHGKAFINEPGTVAVVLMLVIDEDSSLSDLWRDRPLILQLSREASAVIC